MTSRAEAACMGRSPAFIRRNAQRQSGKRFRGSCHAIRGVNLVVMLFNSPIEVDKPSWHLAGLLTYTSSEHERLPGSDAASGWDFPCSVLGAYSYGVVADSHRLPEHQMIRTIASTCFGLYRMYQRSSSSVRRNTVRFFLHQSLILALPLPFLEHAGRIPSSTDYKP